GLFHLVTADQYGHSELLNSEHRHFADSIADEIRANNSHRRSTRLILPVGPVGQYPILAEIINDENISLKACWFFMMDEHCDENGRVLDPTHPLSFRGIFQDMFLDRVRRRLRLPKRQVIFPNQQNLHTLKRKIEAGGGVDTTYGGIGIHGHIAYNEPEANVRESDPRLVDLNDFTRTINAVRAGTGGNLEGHPRKGLTLGMQQVLAASRVRLYCRNGIALDWANTVLRLALFGRPGDDYPVTYVQQHPDWMVVTDEDTARSPEHVL
ncbi:MAG: hypothetical protein ABGZ17_12855, partial [Planctomycetaceae bacterium]